MKEELIQTALDNLKMLTGIVGKWENTKLPGIDGRVVVYTNDEEITLNAVFKQEIRNYQVPQIIEHFNKQDSPIIVARRIFPKIKEELRHHNISYLEANGNIYLKKKKTLVWLDTQKPYYENKTKVGRALNKTGLKVIFHLLLDESLLNETFREIAKKTSVSLGNINYVMNGLMELGHIVRQNKKKAILHNKKELFERWMRGYEERLKPALFMGNFSFIKSNDDNSWKTIPLNPSATSWGGEPAGDILTGHLRPEIFTLYTREPKIDLIKNYGIFPDDLGKIRVYSMFWNEDMENPELSSKNVVPPILVYFDLITTNEKRCRETAQMIYDQYIAQNL